MKIVFIGAGNLATRLGMALFAKGNEIIQVYSRTTESAKLLGEKVNAPYTDNIKQITPEADLYIFSVKDDVLSGLLELIPSNKGLWVHTAGSIPMEVFYKHHNRFGVFYPLQTFSKHREVNFSVIPIYIEAKNTDDLTILKNLASTISDNVIEATSKQRKYLHVAAVFACNFTNHMYAIAAKLLEDKGLRFDQLLPLIDETAQKVHTLHPLDAQTGPAIRFDENVINRHLDMLIDEDLKKIYRLLSESIHETAKKRI